MRKISAILFLTVLVFSQTELHQILKLPILVQHYFEHKAESKDISLSQFIVLHYFSGDPVDDDYARDMQLPFKTNDCLQVITSIVVPEEIVFELPFETPLIKDFPKFHNDWIESSYAKSIFRPPQFA